MSNHHKSGFISQIISFIGGPVSRIMERRQRLKRSAVTAPAGTQTIVRTHSFVKRIDKITIGSQRVIWGCLFGPGVWEFTVSAHVPVRKNASGLLPPNAVLALKAGRLEDSRAFPTDHPKSWPIWMLLRHHGAGGELSVYGYTFVEGTTATLRDVSIWGLLSTDETIEEI